MKQIVIIGAGYMGTAMAWPLRDRGHRVNLVGTPLDEEIITECQKTGIHPKLKRKLPDGVKVFPFSRVDEALERAEIIVSGVSSSGVCWIAEVLQVRVRPGQIVVGVTKGLDISEDGRLRIFPQLIQEYLPKAIRSTVLQAAIGGPCIAGELAGRRQTCVVIGAATYSVARALAELFRTDYYHVWATEDLFSLEVSAALKNFYALAVGTAYGILERGGGIDFAGASMHNLASALFAQSTVEMHRVLRLTGGNPEFAFSLPGVGDLFVTSSGGRSVRMGNLLGSGLPYSHAKLQLQGETLEAVEIVQGMSRWIIAREKKGEIRSNELPLMKEIIQVIVQGKKLTLEPNRWFDKVFHAEA